MESVDGVDVSWMTHSSNSSQKDNHSKTRPAHDTQPPQSPQPITEVENTIPAVESAPELVQNENAPQPREPRATSPKAIPARPGLSKAGQGASPSPTRRPSWLSSISSKFSSSSSTGSHNNTASPVPSPQIPAQDPAQEPLVPTGPYSPRHVMLPHGAKGTGDEPYIPAPPKSSQGSFLQSALRRLSSSSSASGGQSVAMSKGAQHGLIDRMVLNVDPHRERCSIAELHQAKLRRVAFCVDVEIASGPRYYDDDSEIAEPAKLTRDKTRLLEKGEGAALKHPEVYKDAGDAGVSKHSAPESHTETGQDTLGGTTQTEGTIPISEKDTSKKKEKKKRSEEERKARKEKKRKQAEENGAIPVELVREHANRSDTSHGSTPESRTPRTRASPTIDPVRIYRRCCQLRETPILKKITEQLIASVSPAGQPGVVSKLDLTGYWLHLRDIVTLGDYLAVVPVKELIMENCGLTDEGVRVILAGLLAAKPIDCLGPRIRKPAKDGEVAQGGVIERLVLKDNNKIGREGWRHVCFFVNMCRSLKSLDLSKVPFPQSPVQPATHGHIQNGNLSRTVSASSANCELSSLLAKAIGERLAGSEFELFNIAECGFTTEQLGDLVDGFIKSGLRRLGIAGNRITPEGMKHVARFIREGDCEGLDLGGNDLRDQLGTVVDALDERCRLYALSLADCNLSPEPLWALFSALAKLENFRFIDLSQNHDLFDANPSALSLLCRYLPKMPLLKRIHLTDVSMTPEQAIALAEIFPDTPSLAHVNIMDNPKLAALATAKDEANQEEACALYASLMAAVRVSKTIVCIDIEVPSNDSSEVVKALAKQVVAYCLWNMERGPVAEISQAVSEPTGDEKEVAVPDVLLHLVGHAAGSQHLSVEDESAPDEDYVIGGTGVVKALGICLRNSGLDARRSYSGGASPDVLDNPERTLTDSVTGGKAKQVSKNLLGSARRIRARLQPALIKEARESVSYNYQRLTALDQTLEGMIKRFEDEFPETRLQSAAALPRDTGTEQQSSPADSLDLSNIAEGQSSDNEQSLSESHLPDDDYGVGPMISRHNSDVSLASRALSQEEGRMHRFGQKFRRDIIKADDPECEPSTVDSGEHIRILRAMVDGIGGKELKKRYEDDGEDAVLEELSNEGSVLRAQLIDSDPEYWKMFVESQKAAQKNQAVHSRARTDSNAIE